MYSVIVSMIVRADQRAVFEKAVTRLAAAVRANEPDNLAYYLLRTRDDPSKYRMIEIYASKEAFKAHLGASYVRDTNLEVAKTLIGTPELEVVELIA